MNIALWTPFMTNSNAVTLCQPEIRHKPGNETDPHHNQSQGCLFGLQRDDSQCMAEQKTQLGTYGM